ncbi:MAG: four helix bundle protein [Calditrichaeota bacterium]|nr:MAG: four helix bundle protein [Calditrichota bacterium]
MNFYEWEKSVPEFLKNDPLWKMKVYRLALFLCDIGWHDVTKLMKDRRTIAIADQLYRALGSVCANIEEGYSRGSSRDRVRFYEYSLGSARESRGWYYRGRHILGKEVLEHRLKLLTEVICLLMSAVPKVRGHKIGEPQPVYSVSKNSESYPSKQLTEQELEMLLTDVPFCTT